MDNNEIAQALILELKQEIQDCSKTIAEQAETIKALKGQLALAQNDSAYEVAL